jgi:hypothetical protein
MRYEPLLLPCEKRDREASLSYLSVLLRTAPWKKRFLRESSVPQRANKFFIFYGTRKSITVFTEIIYGPHSVPLEFNLRPHTIFVPGWIWCLNIIPSTLEFFKQSHSLDFHTKLWRHLSCFCVWYKSHPCNPLELVSLILLDEGYTLWSSSLCKFLFILWFVEWFDCDHPYVANLHFKGLQEEFVVSS